MLIGWCATSATINLLEVVIFNFLEVMIFNLLKVVIFLLNSGIFRVWNTRRVRVWNEFLTHLLSRVTDGIGFDLTGAGMGGQYPSGTYPLPFLLQLIYVVRPHFWTN